MNILVTGAAGGMGLAACELLHADGYAVIGTDIAEPARNTGWRFIRADLTKKEDAADIAAVLTRQDIRLDAVIHHAGIYDLNSLVEMTEADMSRIWNVNFFAAVRLNRLLLPLLAPGARIVLTSSELAPLDPLPFTGIYGITKTAVEKYAFSLRMELQLLGYRVVVLRPGAVRTPLLGVSEKRLDAFTAGTAHYSYNAQRFRRIVSSVEAKNVPPERIARTDLRILQAKHPKYIYNVNRNPALRLMHLLPARVQTALIRRILGQP